MMAKIRCLCPSISPPTALMPCQSSSSQHVGNMPVTFQNVAEFWSTCMSTLTQKWPQHKICMSWIANTYPLLVAPTSTHQGTTTKQIEKRNGNNHSNLKTATNWSDHSHGSDSKYRRLHQLTNPNIARRNYIIGTHLVWMCWFDCNYLIVMFSLKIAGHRVNFPHGKWVNPWWIRLCLASWVKQIG